MLANGKKQYPEAIILVITDSRGTFHEMGFAGDPWAIAGRVDPFVLPLPAGARILDAATVGVDPVMMLTGPIPATRTLLERNAMTIDDLDRIEINEAFASVVCAWRRELEPEMDRVNVNGGALALGHPLGCSGARLVTTLLHELERADKELGLVTMCTAGGNGTGTLLQRI